MKRATGLRKAVLFVTPILVASLFTVGVATAAPPERDGARGKISMTVHTHSSEFRGPGGAPTLFPTDPLSFDIEEGEQFSYSSVSCEDPARFNDKALNFQPDYPGIDDPAPVRHFVEGTVVEDSGDTGEIEGTITTFLCENGEEGDQILFEFEAEFVRTSDNQLKLVDGTFDIEGGTGRFEDIKGGGTFTGEITCLPTVLENEGAESCAELGVFSDFIANLNGTFSDPTT